jgi:UDP-4-amino-4-deoxy-L-arabinose formyltransferase/UDP-glucuronic acid dehydrogenase (UDP-4-keto-hexauronic acid decarboxylating)
MLREKFAAHPLRSHFPPNGGVQHIEASAYYGAGYQDVQHRRPSIRQARNILGWQPEVPFEQSVSETLDYFLNNVADCAKGESCAVSACV